MAEILTLYNNPTGTGRTLTWEQGESGSHTYDLIIIDQTGQPVDLTGCSVALYFKPPSGTIQIGATVSSSGDSASLTVPGEATQSPGAYQAWVAVVRPSPQQNIIINNLAIIIRANAVDASAPEAEPYFGTLTQMIADGQALINDLEQQTPWPVSKGGTGASTAAGARANLSVAATDHTHSLSGSSITGVLPITKGGTGATYPVAARIALGAVGTDDIIQISKGGTGAVSPAVARQNLGAMAADKIIPIDQGGGGGTTAQESAKNIMDDASTEWHDLPLASGATPGPYRKPQYRIIGNHVFVSGDVAITINGTTLALIAQLPEGYGPPGNVYKGAMATGFQLGRLLIGSARNLYVEWVYSLQTGNRFDGQLSWICIDMDWYVDTQASPANIIAAENEVSNDTA